MKKTILLLFLLSAFQNLHLLAQVPQSTNDFYDDAPTVRLPDAVIEIGGEIANPGKVAFDNLPLRSVIVKETRYNGNSLEFVGAYRYDGYSLYDILNGVKIVKRNETEFSPIIDLLVVVENVKGEKAVFTWGEIFYPANPHKILVANRVTRIVPSKTKELWPLPTETKIVAGTDLISERNIGNPVKITVMSYPRSFVVDRSKTYSKDITLLSNREEVVKISKFPEKKQAYQYSTVFYGRGRGIHGITDFKGIRLSDILNFAKPTSGHDLREGVLCIAGADGYRAVFTVSEVFNRNDFTEILLIDAIKDKESGIFSLFAAPDYFSDRAIKGIKTIAVEKISDLETIKR